MENSKLTKGPEMCEGTDLICVICRVVVGMGIPTGFPYGWEW